MAIRWSGEECAIALLLHQKDWSYNNIGRELSRSRDSVRLKIKGYSGYKPTPITPEDWRGADEYLLSHGHSDITTKGDGGAVNTNKASNNPPSSNPHNTMEGL